MTNFLKNIGPARFEKFAGCKFWSKKVLSNGDVEYGRPMNSSLYASWIANVRNNVEGHGLTVVKTYSGTQSRNSYESVDFGFIVVRP